MGKNKRQTSKNEDWVRGINENSSYGVPGFFKIMSQTLNEYKSHNWNRVIFTIQCQDFTGILQNLIQHQIMRLCTAIARSS